MHFYKKYPGRDWEDDKVLENGNYECFCIKCLKPFVGYKSRVVCFECAAIIERSNIHE
jgi:hypothetical protein